MNIYLWFNEKKWKSLTVQLALVTLLAPCSAVAASPFEMTITPVGVNFDYDCIKFDINLDVPGYGPLKLDNGVCAGDYEPSKDLGDFRYDRDDARSGIDTDTIVTIRVKDLVLVKWSTLLEGYYIFHEWKLYKKGIAKPLISDGVPLFGRWGSGTNLKGSMKIRYFSPEKLELEITSRRFEVLPKLAPLHHYNPEHEGYAGTVILKKKIKYVFSKNAATLESGSLSVLKSFNETYQEIADYFHVDRRELQAYDSWVELPMDENKFNQLFYTHCDFPRSLYDLWE